jgi:hypothetical protein
MSSTLPKSSIIWGFKKEFQRCFSRQLQARFAGVFGIRTNDLSKKGSQKQAKDQGLIEKVRARSPLHQIEFLLFRKYINFSTTGFIQSNKGQKKKIQRKHYEK